MHSLWRNGFKKISGWIASSFFEHRSCLKVSYIWQQIIKSVYSLDITRLSECFDSDGVFVKLAITILMYSPLDFLDTTEDKN